mmetsp:Transcript_24674/g.37411  ORF Transcript_24674/g.37411 Transcript_24674/m.37411 type:complete len:203 (-) Transcript_24674:1306-1914(-)
MRSLLKLDMISMSCVTQSAVWAATDSSGSSPSLYLYWLYSHRSPCLQRRRSTICCKFGNAVVITAIALYFFTLSTLYSVIGTIVFFAESLIFLFKRARIISSGERNTKICTSSSVLRSSNTKSTSPTVATTLALEQVNCFCFLLSGYDIAPTQNEMLHSLYMYSNSDSICVGGLDGRTRPVGRQPARDAQQFGQHLLWRVGR